MLPVVAGSDVVHRRVPGRVLGAAALKTTQQKSTWSSSDPNQHRGFLSGRTQMLGGCKDANKLPLAEGEGVERVCGWLWLHRGCALSCQKGVRGLGQLDFLAGCSVINKID